MLILLETFHMLLYDDKKREGILMPISSAYLDRQEMPVGHEYEVHHKTVPIPSTAQFHYHDFFEFYFFITGSIRMIVENRTFQLEPYMLVVIPPGNMHLATSMEPDVLYERMILYTTRDCLRELSSSELNLTAWTDSLNTRDRYLFNLDEGTFASCRRIVDDIVASSGEDIPASRHINRCRISALLGILAQFTLKDHAQPNVLPVTRVGQLIDYINQHLDEHLTLDELAEHFFISKYYMLHEFKQYTCTSVYSYIQSKRVINAKTLMQAGVSPGEACRMSGFGDYSSFYKTFVRYVGIPPMNYLKKQRRS